MIVKWWKPLAYQQSNRFNLLVSHPPGVHVDLLTSRCQHLVMSGPCRYRDCNCHYPWFCWDQSLWFWSRHSQTPFQGECCLMGHMDSQHRWSKWMDSCPTIGFYSTLLKGVVQKCQHLPVWTKCMKGAKPEYNLFLKCSSHVNCGTIGTVTNCWPTLLWWLFRV